MTVSSERNPEINVLDDPSIVADGIADNRDELATLINSHPGKVIVFPPGIYGISNAINVNTPTHDGTTLVFKEGAMLKKLSTWTAAAEAMNVSGDNTTIHASGTFIDGTRATETGGGISWTGQGGRIIGGTVEKCADAGITCTVGGELTCYGVTSRDNVDGASAGHGFAATLDGLLKLYDCEAYGNDGHGVRLNGHVSTPGNRARPGCHIDGRFDDNGGTGVTILCPGGTIGEVYANGNYQGGVNFGRVATDFAVNGWKVGRLEVENAGDSPTWGENATAGQGDSVSLSNSNDNRFGQILSVDPVGRGLAVIEGSANGSSGNVFNSVSLTQPTRATKTIAYDVKGTSQRNRIGSLSATGHRWGAWYGDSMQSAEAASFNSIGLLNVDGLTNGIWKVANGSYNHIETIMALACDDVSPSALIDWDAGQRTITSVTSNVLLATVVHGLTANQPVTFSGTLPTGLAAATTYYVIAVDDDQFSVSATPGPGGAVTITNTTTDFTLLTGLVVDNNTVGHYNHSDLPAGPPSVSRQTGGAASNNIFQQVAGATSMAFNGSLAVNSVDGTGYLQFREQTTSPTAPAGANRIRVFEDGGHLIMMTPNRNRTLGADVAIQTYVATNVLPGGTRTIDTDTVFDATQWEEVRDYVGALADLVGTLIGDLRAEGIVA